MVDVPDDANDFRECLIRRLHQNAAAEHATVGKYCLANDWFTTSTRGEPIVSRRSKGLP